MFRSILVAVDGSRAASKALEQAIDLAESEGSRLTLISVAELPRWRFSSFPLAVPFPNEDELVHEAETNLERAEALVPDGVPVCTVLRCGSTAKEIVKRVIAGEHDLVVMGSRGLGPAGAVLLGSVSRAVLAHSPVPVLIAPPPRTEVPKLESVSVA